MVMCMESLAAGVADLILRNGKVWTQNPTMPVAQAVACFEGRILAVGSNEQMERLAAPGAQVIDLQGRLLVPGFNDAHIHFYEGGARLSGVQLRDARSEAELRERIGQFASKLPKGTWITGGDWDHENFSPVRLPTRWLIDPVTAEHPVFVSRLDGHMGLANSLALKLAGITRETPDPPGGLIVRDQKGEPTGVLKDTAMDAVWRVIPPPGPTEIEKAVRAAMRHANRHGITSVHDVSASPEVLAVYQKLQASGELTVRIYGLQPLQSWQRLAAVGIRAGFGSDKLRIGGLKGFADGSLGSGTAWFFEPYLDEPGNRGLPSGDLVSPERMREDLRGADAAGLQLAIHAIGDRANSVVLEQFEAVVKANGPRDRRLRIEHAQHLRPQDMARLARLGVIASMQPYHAIDDGRWAERRIGLERAKSTYAFRSLLDVGVRLAFGSDWFVAPIDPIQGIYAAVTRRTLDGKHPDGWIPQERIRVAQAIAAYTLGGAYASFEEKQKGSIEPGKAADLVALSEDILEIAAERINRVRVVLTIFDGKVVYRAP